MSFEKPFIDFWVVSTDKRFMSIQSDNLGVNQAKNLTQTSLPCPRILHSPLDGNSNSGVWNYPVWSFADPPIPTGNPKEQKYFVWILHRRQMLNCVNPRLNSVLGAGWFSHTKKTFQCCSFGPAL